MNSHYGFQKVELNKIANTIILMDIVVLMGSLSSKVIAKEGMVKGIKAFASDFSCRGFKFEVGKAYELPPDQATVLGKAGFHFCVFPADCHKYYPKGGQTRYAEIEAWDVQALEDDTNYVARRIHIVRELKLSTLTGTFTRVDRTAYYKDGKLHREDGPALEWKNGKKEWYHKGIPHREDGPAIQNPDGTKEWYRHGRRHRIDGPAIERPDGTKEWYQDGRRHRIDGPAVEKANGKVKWYRDNSEYIEDNSNTEYHTNDLWYINGKRLRRSIVFHW